MSDEAPPKEPESSGPTMLDVVEFWEQYREAFGSTPFDYDLDIEGRLTRFFWRVAGSVAAAIALYLLVPYILEWAFKFRMPDMDAVAAFVSDGVGRWVAGAFLVSAGALFYLLRCWRRDVYGMVEVCLACMGGWAAFGVFRDTNKLHESGGYVAAWATVIGAMYVVVRGLDNTMEGLKALQAKKAVALARSKPTAKSTPGTSDDEAGTVEE